MLSKVIAAKIVYYACFQISGWPNVILIPVVLDPKQYIGGLFNLEPTP